MEAGLGSIEALELQNTIAEVFDLKVLPTLAFDYPSVRSMAHYLITLKWPNEGSVGVDPRTTLESASMRPTGSSLSCIMGVGCRYPGGALIQQAYIVYFSLLHICYPLEAGYMWYQWW